MRPWNARESKEPILSSGVEIGGWKKMASFRTTLPRARTEAIAWVGCGISIFAWHDAELEQSGRCRERDPLFLDHEHPGAGSGSFKAGSDAPHPGVENVLEALDYPGARVLDTHPTNSTCDRGQESQILMEP